jgi:L-histidine N-alpha-methyltransferase
LQILIDCLPTGGSTVSRTTFTDLLPADFDLVSLREDVRAGLGARAKRLPPKWFYDKVGSELFEEITRLPEYYPTRTERGILAEHAGRMIEASAARSVVELGSGSSEKTRLLLDALTARADRLGEQARYVALDVSADALHGAADDLARRYPRLAIDTVRADFTHQLDRLPAGPNRLVVFLGSTIGNFEPEQRAGFLRALRAVLAPGDHFLLGTDLVKSEHLLVPAYDDAAGVTAAFNLNVLEVINSRLDADFDRSGFEHRAVWDPQQQWMEMRLVARRPMTVTVADLDLLVTLQAGEEMLTEISAKFTPERVRAELPAAGFAPAGWWTDPQGWFALSLWSVG